MPTCMNYVGLMSSASVEFVSMVFIRCSPYIHNIFAHTRCVYIKLTSRDLSLQPWRTTSRQWQDWRSFSFHPSFFSCHRPCALTMNPSGTYMPIHASWIMSFMGSITLRFDIWCASINSTQPDSIPIDKMTIMIESTHLQPFSWMRFRWSLLANQPKTTHANIRIHCV